MELITFLQSGIKLNLIELRIKTLRHVKEFPAHGVITKPHHFPEAHHTLQRVRKWSSSSKLSDWRICFLMPAVSLLSGQRFTEVNKQRLFYKKSFKARKGMWVLKRRRCKSAMFHYTRICLESYELYPIIHTPTKVRQKVFIALKVYFMTVFTFEP